MRGMSSSFGLATVGADPAGSIGSVPRARVSPSVVLFMCVFTSQAAVLVLSPILVEISQDLQVSTAVAGQLRIFAAPVAALVAVLLARFGGAAPLRWILLASTLLVAVGSLARGGLSFVSRSCTRTVAALDRRRWSRRRRCRCRRCVEYTGDARPSRCPCARR